MPDQITIQVHGLKDVREALKGEAPKVAKRILRNTVADVAREVRDEAKRRAPVDEGTLRKSLAVKRRRGTPDYIQTDVIVRHGAGVRFDAYYWHFIEFGTVEMDAQPFITPAVESIRSGIDTVFRQSFVRRFAREMNRRRR